ncbi:substrate-binding domain-containing protein [Snuella sedimenti]|uniref:Substrate-binding domain-containing protein n=1 Tax=Snuella sedimenti TaxID=2798802 RepID=A0A8J7IMR1_9FLAO|nr:substrate-binding domain-containing protein [Snuella sedimenti]MBJ6367437.1 substrate-binding domain-containing protein [Snuella sedimenti]
MVTISDIAKEANVSVGTVDRVLHNREGVSKKTAKKVKAIIKKHNFKTNKIASSLALNKKLKITTLIPQSNADNTFWKAPLMGTQSAQEEVEKFGITVNNFSFDQFDASSYLNTFETLMQSNPDGVVIAPIFIKETHQITKTLDDNNIPYVFINVELEGFNNISFIGQDAFKAGLLAGKLMHLCLKDDYSILIIHTRLNVDNHQAISERIHGFNDYFLNNRLPIKSSIANIIDLNNTEQLKKDLKLILEENPSINGVYVPSSRISVFANCLNNITSKELALIGFDNTEQNIKCLNEDKVSFLISQQPFIQGHKSITLMTNYLIEKKTPEQKIYSPIEILTKENVNFS